MLLSGQEEASEALKNFLGKFGTLRMVDGGDCTPDALFGKLNSVVVAMIQEVCLFFGRKKNTASTSLPGSVGR